MLPSLEWECVGVSRQGRAHIRQEIPNQDSWLCRREGNIVAAAVADGMGSCPRARQGAEATCLALTESAVRKDWINSPEMMLQNAVELRGDMLDGNFNDADSTGLIAAFSLEYVLAAQVGDGVIVVLDSKGYPVCLLEDEKNDGFANQVQGFGYGLCGVPWKYDLWSARDIGGVLMCTDGVDLSSSGDYCALAADIRDAALNCSAAELMEEIGSLLDSWPMDGNQDDKTLVFLYRR